MARWQARRFFDSVPIIKFLRNGPETPIVQALLDEAEAGDWRLVVDALTLVEVTRSRGEPVDLTLFARIFAFFDNDYFFVQEIDKILAEEARDLIMDHPWLRPIDALHIASAIRTKCEIFYTYDEDLIRKLGNAHGMRFTHPEMPPAPEPEPAPEPRPVNLSYMDPY